MNQFITGVIATASLISGLFFLRFWKETGDRLFAIFALAFWLLALTRLMVALSGPSSEHHFIYWLRLAAFGLILFAIIDKNRPKTRD